MSSESSVSKESICIESWIAKDELSRPKGDYYLLAPQLISHKRNNHLEEYLFELPQNGAYTFFYDKDEKRWLRMLLDELIMLPVIRITATRKLSGDQNHKTSLDGDWKISLCENSL